MCFAETVPLLTTLLSFIKTVQNNSDEWKGIKDCKHYPFVFSGIKSACTVVVNRVILLIVRLTTVVCQF